MAQSQLLAIKDKSISKFDTVDITVNEYMTISICEDILKIRQKDISGRSKTSHFSKDNWFELMQFAEIINSFFLLKYEKNFDEQDNNNDVIKPTYTESRQNCKTGKQDKHKSLKKTYPNKM